MIVRAAPKWHLPWLIERTGLERTAGLRAIEAVDSGGRVRGMVGYCGWTKNAVQVHMATETPIVWRHLLKPAFTYPFLEVGVGVLIGVISARNIPSIRMTESMGFVETHRIRDGLEVGVDLVCFELRKEDCRFIALRRAA